jgi:hypothetical protein
MQDHCEVCANFRPDANHGARRTSTLRFGSREIVLCGAHARIAERSGVTTLEELRDFYRESEGQRSYVSRRAHSELSPPGRALRRPGRRVADAR